MPGDFANETPNVRAHCCSGPTDQWTRYSEGGQSVSGAAKHSSPLIFPIQICTSCRLGQSRQRRKRPPPTPEDPCNLLIDPWVRCGLHLLRSVYTPFCRPAPHLWLMDRTLHRGDVPPAILSTSEFSPISATCNVSFLVHVFDLHLSMLSDSGSTTTTPEDASRLTPGAWDTHTK